ncbi:Inner membrane protein YhhQ [Aliarcobacter thereius]|uniref:Probable queuosine precursor transporter n=2 Tax=Aliarcobacter thereius TaxID=544718 RepID=A0A1C0B9E4_9BACT|nr:queuosine precursor transporter [Aliarcobacter thereius]OCL88659.1 Inner membrane protein YhhQ [Aliarcobacter thereius]OCL92154.1 Inner membrane protein YhhQ [Aliarcobacter thereius]OCL94750.1 Inner membrane protein YhhQ [Aliarcobacter thereius LMG 24486]OCM00198.1 Inner membrane protein YhhQ [Aliarcobacter thereius]QBF15374.1 putative vitamin uptake transporter [Aliarcobacter thereius LMG 24486]
MTKKQLILYVTIFSSLVITANYTVQFPINEWLTYGAIMFPFTFLLTDILSENFEKKEVLNVIKYGVLIAIIPTILIAGWQIAFASLTCLVVSQYINVRIFKFLKRKFINLWWLRSNGSTLIGQFFDTSIFFILAFSFVMPFETILKLIIGDYLIKVSLALLDMPIFYLIAIKFREKIFHRA